METKQALVVTGTKRELFLSVRPLAAHCQFEYQERLDGRLTDIFLRSSDAVDFFQHHPAFPAVKHFSSDHALNEELKDRQYIISQRLDLSQVLEYAVQIGTSFMSQLCYGLSVPDCEEFGVIAYPNSAIGSACHRLEEKLRQGQGRDGILAVIYIDPADGARMLRWGDVIVQLAHSKLVPVVLFKNSNDDGGMTEHEVRHLLGGELPSNYYHIQEVRSLWELAWWCLQSSAIFTLESWFAHFAAALPHTPMLIINKKADAPFRYSSPFIRYVDYDLEKFSYELIRETSEVAVMHQYLH